MRALIFTDKSPKQPVALARLVDGKVQWTGMANPASLQVRDPDTAELLRPSDGERYLRALPYMFRNVYMWAEVEED